MGRHGALLEQIILKPSLSYLLLPLNTVCSAEKQHISIL